MNQGNIALTLSSSDMTGNITSNAINLINQYAYSIQAVWSGGSSPVGTFKLQGSIDASDTGVSPGLPVPTNWTDIASASQSISGTPGSILYDVTECSYRWVRLVYTATSGSATLTARANVKGS